jgi:hypothetical protein
MGRRDRGRARREVVAWRKLVHHDPLAPRGGLFGCAMSANPENLVAILAVALAAMTAKGGGFNCMR